jgi:hypothetical protein
MSDNPHKGAFKAIFTIIDLMGLAFILPAGEMFTQYRYEQGFLWLVVGAVFPFLGEVLLPKIREVISQDAKKSPSPDVSGRKDNRAVMALKYTLVSIVLLTGILTLIYWVAGWSPYANLPSVSIDTVVRLYLRPNNKRQYLFDMGTKDRERFSVYVSKDGNFTVLFVDALGEQHPLQIPITLEKFPAGKRIYLCPEVIAGDNFTIIRVSVDNKEVGFLKLPFKTKLGSLDVLNGTVGADLDGNNGASFDLDILMAAGRSITKKDRSKLYEIQGCPVNSLRSCC